MDWTDTQDLLSPATVRQLLQDDTLLGGGGAVLPPAPAVPPAPSSNPAAAPGQPILRDDELERLLVSWQGQQTIKCWRHSGVCASVGQHLA